jgi:pectinesterase
MSASETSGSKTTASKATGNETTESEVEILLVGQSSICDYETIQEAIDVLEQLNPPVKPAVLYIMQGTYEEQVRIHRSHLHIIGIGKVTVTANRYAKELDQQGQEIGTFATPTFFVGGHDVVVENLEICNTAGQGKEIGQALAVYAHGDELIFRNCVFRGHQDTLFTGPLPPAPKKQSHFGGVELKEYHISYRQCYDRCYIEGTVDFIFGGATAYFEHCQLHSLRHCYGGAGYVTAASTPQGRRYGYVFQSCYLTAEDGVTDVFLGRPWREYAQTMFIDCHMGAHIHPEGWHNWDDTHNEEIVRYSEYNSKLANEAIGENEIATRVAWASYYKSSDEVLTKEMIFEGTDFWKKV